MANVCRVRVELRHLSSHASWDERQRAFHALEKAFHKRVKEVGIKSLYREREFFESKGEKRRRKRRASEYQRWLEKQEENRD